MIIKDKVKRNFSKGAKTYDKFAVVQKHMASILESFIDGSDEMLNILEIGSGTGIFTECLLKKFPNSKIHLLDISEEMLDYSRRKFKKHKNLEYFLGDAEEYKFNKKYDLIVSNASFQWFNDLEKSLEKLKYFLKPNGQLIFSIFAEGTYFELRDSFKNVDPEYDFSQKFKSVAEILSYSSSLELLEEEKYYEYYDGIFPFLNAIKNIGANSAKDKKKLLTKNKLQQIEEIYKSKYSKDGNLRVTNHLLYFRLENS